jgi:hypothetical protein
MNTREIRGHWFRGHFYEGEWHLRAEENRAEPCVLVFGGIDKLDAIEEVRSLHRLIFQRLDPAVRAWREAKKKPDNLWPDLGDLVEWLMEGKSAPNDKYAGGKPHEVTGWKPE